MYVSHCECEKWLLSAPIIVSSLSLVPFIDIHKPLLSKPLLKLGILIHMGIGCTVWYGFTPGDGINIPTEGLALLFSLIENYESFLTNPDVHVQPGLSVLA